MVHRFLVLVAFCFFSFSQSAGWFCYAGFPGHAERLFGIGDSMISYYLLIGPLAFVAATPLFIWMLDKKGLRLSCCVAMLCVLFGAIMRVVSLFFPPNVGWALAMCGQLGTSVAGVVAMAAPPKISSVWFPPSERPASTAVGVVVNSMGNAVGFLLGLVCNSPKFSAPFDCVSFQVYLQLGVASMATVLVLLFVRDAPEIASSAATDRDVSLIALLPSLGTLLCNFNFLFLAIVAGCSQGLFATWAGLMDLLLVDEGTTVSAWLGFAANVAGILGGLLCGAVATKIPRRYKLFIIVLYLSAGGVFVLFNLMLLKIVPKAMWGLGLCISIGSLLMGAGNVLFYELAVEISFPAGEGLIGCIVTVLNNAFGAIMYPLQSNLTSNDIMWINAGNSIFFGLAMIILKETYNRHACDEKGKILASSESALLLSNIQEK